jgi:uncharacterized protein YjbI with pentapeptide repeats
MILISSQISYFTHLTARQSNERCLVDNDHSDSDHTGHLAHTQRCDALRYSTLLYATLRYSTLLYTTLRYSTLRYSTLLYATLRYSTLLYATLRYSTLLYATLRYSTLIYANLLYAIIRYSSRDKNHLKTHIRTCKKGLFCL